MFTTHVYAPHLICRVLQTPPRRTLGYLVQSSLTLQIKTREIGIDQRLAHAISTTILYEINLPAWKREGLQRKDGQYHFSRSGYDGFFHYLTVSTTLKQGRTTPPDLAEHMFQLENLVNAHPYLGSLLQNITYFLSMPERFVKEGSVQRA